MTTLREYLNAESPSDPRREALTATIRRNGEAVEYLSREQTRLVNGIAYRKRKNMVHLLPKWEAELEHVEAALEAAGASLTIARAQRDEIESARRDLQREVLRTTYQQIADTLIGDVGAYEAADLVITVMTSYSVYEVELWSGEYRVWHATDCPAIDEHGHPQAGRWMGKTPAGYLPCPDCTPQTAKDSVHGYSATVYGPEKQWKSPVGDPKVNWGTIGSMTVEDATAMHKVHTWSLSLASRLREALDQPLPEAAEALLKEAAE